MKSFACFFCIWIITAGCLAAQTVSFGIKGGLPFMTPTVSDNESPPYLVGPSVEVRLPWGFSIEADALYRRIGTTQPVELLGVFAVLNAPSNVLTVLVPTPIDRYRGNAWEFPILAKYYFRPRDPRWQPFVGAGYAFRTTRYSVSTTQTTINDLTCVIATTPYTSTYTSDTGVGATFAAGLRTHLGRLAVLPEFRYTRWGSSDGLLQKNEANFFLGVNY